MKENLEKVIGYIRVSTDNQAKVDKFGIEAQKEAIYKYCSRNGKCLIDWAIDVESGAEENRPELNKLIYERCREGGIDGIVVAKSDRIARDINIYFYVKHELLKNQIKLYSVSEDFGAMGVFASVLEAFVICIAEQERINITSRTKAGRDVKSKTGGYSGGKPAYGYKVVDRKLEIVEPEAQVVRFIYGMYRNGYTLEEIKLELNRRMIPTRAGKLLWSVSTISSILSNKMLYMGWYQYGKMDYVKGSQPAILGGEYAGDYRVVKDARQKSPEEIEKKATRTGVAPDGFKPEEINTTNG